MRIGIGASAVVAAMLLLLASGCGGSKKSSSPGTTSSAITTTSAATTSAGGGTVSVNDWANGFCSAVFNWGTAMRSVGQSLRANPTKSNLQATVATIKNANQTLIASLQSLGKPDTTGGAQAKAAVDQLATALRGHSDQINSAIKSLSGAAGLKTTAAAVSTNLVAMGEAFRTSLSTLRSLSQSAKGSFKQAFKDSSACQKIQRSNS